MKEHAISQDEAEEYKGGAAAILTVKKECVIVTTHRDDPAIKKGLAAFYDALSLDGLLSKHDIYWMIYAHQFAHCAQYLYRKGNHPGIGKMMLQTALGRQPTDSLKQAFADGLQENVADVFAVLKLQQSYIRQNAQDITSGLLPQLSPSAVLLVEYRKERETTSKPVTTEPMAQVLISVLRQPEVLKMATDQDIFITAMRLTAARLKVVGQVAGLEPDVARKLHYPQHYLAMGSASFLENHIMVNQPMNNAYKKFHQKYAEPLKTYVHWLRCCQHWS